jgi:outer membrane protein TolC
LESLRIPTLIARDLPIRRQQAMLGVSIASAALEQAEYDTVYAVERTYYSVVYARDQAQVARKLVEKLEALRKDVQVRIDAGTTTVDKNDVTSLTVYIRLAQTRLIQAEEGANRALAALKEAIGITNPCCGLDLTTGALPDPRWQICCDDIVSWALARRGELAQTSLLAEITCLEVDAQSTTHRVRKETFAAGADIHSKLVPPGEANGDYRPAAIPPEMPTLLAGCKSQRMERARALSARAAAVADKTRNLIALEAEDAYLKWVEASRKVVAAREAAQSADELSSRRGQAWRESGKGSIKELNETEVLAAQARSQYNEALFQQVIALAALERVTAGGFCPALSAGSTPVVDSQPAAHAPGNAKATDLIPAVH